MNAINRYYLIIAVILTFMFGYYLKSCFAVGLAIDCYGPGCDNTFCSNKIFYPFVPFYILALIPIFVVFPLIAALLNIDASIRDSLALTLTPVILFPAFYMVVYVAGAVVKKIISFSKPKQL
jgi:hypothetical protein